MRGQLSRFRFALTLVGSVAATLAMAETAPPVWSGPTTKVKVGITARPDQAIQELAIARGFFRQQGIEIERVPSGSGNDFIPPLALNQIQVASGSPNAALFNALNRGIDLRIVADYARLRGADDGTISIVVRDDLLQSQAIKGPIDLKNKTIGLLPGRGQMSYLLVDSMLKKNGMAWSDIKVQNLGFSDMLVALTNKRIDAAFMIEPLITTAAAKGIAKPLVKGGEVEGGAHMAVLLYSAEFAKQSDLATRFMTAYLQGVRAYHEAFAEKKDQEAAIEILTRTLSVKDAEVWRKMPAQYTDLNGTIDVADLKRQAAAYKQLGDISGPVPDIDKYVDQSFAKAAADKLGRR